MKRWRRSPSPRPEHSLARRYLLADLSESERAAADERLFASDAFFAEVLAAEGELMEGYLESQLPDGEHGRFESHFLASEPRRHSLEALRGLKQRAQRSEPMRSPGKPAPLAARAARRRWLLVAGLVVVALLVVIVNAPRSGPTATTTGERLAPAGPASAPARPRPAIESPAATERVVVLALSSGLVRGARSAPEIERPAATERVRLDLDAALLAGATSYRALLLTADRKRVWEERNLRIDDSGRNRRILAFVPATLLAPEDYVLILSAPRAGGAPEDVAEYFFRVR